MKYYNKYGELDEHGDWCNRELVDRFSKIIEIQNYLVSDLTQKNNDLKKALYRQTQENNTLTKMINDKINQIYISDPYDNLCQLQKLFVFMQQMGKKLKYRKN